MTLGTFLSAEEQSRRFLRQTVPPGYDPSALSVALMTVILRDYRRESVPGPLPNRELRALTAPTYLLMGEHDRAFPPRAVIRRARRTLPDLEKVEILARAAHGMTSEHSEAINQRLRDWLADHPMGRTTYD